MLSRVFILLKTILMSKHQLRKENLLTIPHSKTTDVFVVEGGSHSQHRSINIRFSITINETKKTDIFANEQSSWGTNMGDLLQSACHLEYIDN